jgi:hypothetical protein
VVQEMVGAIGFEPNPPQPLQTLGGLGWQRGTAMEAVEHLLDMVRTLARFARNRSLLSGKARSQGLEGQNVRPYGE